MEGTSQPGDRGSKRFGSRKVRTPQGRMLGNAQAGKPDGKCNREQTAHGPPSFEQSNDLAGTGKGETVR